jgi:epoxyqueuosine reductase
MSITEDVKTFAKRLGLDVVGVTSADPFADAARRIKEQIQRGLRPKWDVQTIDAYCDPRSLLASARSIIVATECYLTSEESDLSRDMGPHGTIARYTWRNYYYDVRTKLAKVATFLKKKTRASVQSRCYSNGPLAEKPMAERAGVGWYGKNGIILTRDYGSWVVLGALVTNIALEQDEPLKRSCGSCQACIKACPTKAIIEPYVLNMPKCLQYITHKQQAMPASIREIWGNRLYGCMTCQDVCPLNRRVKPKNRKPKSGYVGPSLPLIPILQMTEKEYRKHFHENQIGEWWVSFGAVQRNAAVALGNIGDPRAVLVLSSVLRRSRSFIVRGHAAWALGKIGGQDARLALKEASSREKNPNVRVEIENALKS